MDDIKKKLLSVLLSKVGGVPLKKVELDYRRLVREPLEWRNFNFKSLEQFLEALPDIARLEKKNGEIYVYGIAGNMFTNPTARKAQYKTPTSEPAQNYRSDSSPDMVVFIGNLPFNATKEDLGPFLSAYPLQCFRIKKKGDMSCAFVETSRTVGERMCIELNRKKFGDRKLIVEASTGQKKYAPKNSDDSSRDNKSSTGSDLDGRVTGTANNMDALPTGVRVAGRETSNGFREMKPLSVDVETVKPTSYPSNDFGGWSRASGSFCVGNQMHPRPLDLYLPHTVSAQINDRILSEKEPEEEGSRLIWDSDDELPPLVDSRLEDYQIESMVKYSDRKENLQSSNVNMRAREPVEEISGADNHFNLVPSAANGFHPGFGPSAKPPANNHMSNSASESGRRAKKSRDGFNLYVKNIPLGVTEIELQDLFKNCMKIVPLYPSVCFVIYETMEEVLTAAGQIWTLRGSLLSVDVATRHKTADSSCQADHQYNSDFHPKFEQLTCTIDNELKRKVSIPVRKCADKDTPMPNISAQHSDDSRRQFSNYSASSSVPRDLVAANHDGNFNSLSNNWAHLDNSSSRKHDKCPHLMSNVRSPTSAAAQCMSEVVSSSNDELGFKLPQMPRGSSQSLSCRGMSPSQKVVNENVKMDSTFAESELTCRKALADARLEDVNSSRPDCSGNWLRPSPNSPSGSSPSSIPKEMRLKELLGLYKDTCPSGILPGSLQLTDVVEIIVTVVVPECDNSFLWGQLASEPWKSELEQMYLLGAKMAEIERTLVRVTADQRRGIAKYDDDWCRVWIKERGRWESVVFFVDFGNTETVPNESIFELPDEFWQVRPAAVPFKILDNSRMNVMEYLNNMVTAKVKKDEQHSLIVEIYDVCVKS